MSQIGFVPVTPATAQLPDSNGEFELFLDSSDGNRGKLKAFDGSIISFAERFLNGSGVPAGSLGSVDDFYIDNLTQNLYRKTGPSTWALDASLIGPQGPTGPQGIQGIQGPQGNVGPQGPQGPVDLEHIFTNTAAFTLPNSTAKQAVDGGTFNFVGGNYVATTIWTYSPHSTGNDMEFDWRLDNGLITGTDTAEEGKDTSGAQMHPRGMQFDLGAVAAGNHDLELFFSKETAGGTATLDYLSLFIWRVG